MGIVERIAERLTYLDVNVFIYALEGHPQYLAVVSELFAAIDRGTVRAVTSELSLAEALVKPFMDRREDLQAVYMKAIAPAPFLEVLPVSRDVLIEAARTRSNHGVRLPDSIHLATARQGGCGVFLTNDLNIPAAGIEIIRLSDLLTGS